MNKRSGSSLPDYWNWNLENDYWQNGIKYIAGVDEAGRGALCGPVVASAVIFNQPFSEWEVIRDSKKLSPEQRKRSYHVILNHAFCVGVGLANSNEIDTINIRNATHIAMIHAINNLSIIPDIILVDGNAKPVQSSHVRCIIKGDDSVVSIAAASIIAKVFRDYLMQEYAKTYPAYGFEKHKGYGTAEHLLRIEKFGITPWHRLSFRNTHYRQHKLFR
jgi:ribonuclease HII